MLSRDMERLEVNFEGVLDMEQVPQLLLVVDPRHEAIAVTEARQMGIPVVAIMSSDCDVRAVQKPVVLNDAHRQSVALALSELVNAYLDGKASYVPKAPAPKVA
jgi:small subunit ribosomal protein S2